MNSLYSKTIKLLFIISITVLSSFSTQAQDLITETRAGTYLKSTDKSNLIYQEVDRIEQVKSFDKVQLLQLSDQQNALTREKSNFVKDAVYFQKDEKAFAEFYKNKRSQLRMAIPIGGSKSIELVLIKEDIFASGFMSSSTKKGTFKYDQSRVAHYKGYVEGNPNSMAAISIFKNDIAGLISDENGNYNLGSMSDNKSTLVLYLSLIHI